MEDEVLNQEQEQEIIEPTDTSIQNEGAPDLEQELGEDEKGGEKFSVDDLDFSEESYKVGSYDLSKYKDIIPEYNLTQLEDYAKKYEEKGFTQEQIEWLIDQEIEGYEPPSREKIAEELNKSLSVAEKRNYKQVGSQLREILNQNDLGQFYEEAMSNPIVYKIINSILSAKGGANIGVKTERETRTQKYISGEQAVNTMTELIGKMEQKDLQAKAKELYAQLKTDEDKKLFNEVIKPII